MYFQSFELRVNRILTETLLQEDDASTHAELVVANVEQLELVVEAEEASQMNAVGRHEFVVGEKQVAQHFVHLQRHRCQPRDEHETSVSKHSGGTVQAEWMGGRYRES